MAWSPEIRRHARPKRRPWYTITVRGHTHYLGTDLAVAHTRAGAILAAAGVRREAPETVGGLCLQWLAGREREKWRLAYWLRYAAATPLTDLAPGHLQGYADWLAGHPLSRRTVRTYVQHARTAWEWGRRQGWIACEAATVHTAPPVPNPRDEDPARLAAAFATLPPPARDLCMFALSVGCRPSEARGLTWELADEGLRTGAICLVAHKTARAGKTRTIYLTPPAEAVLRARPRATRWVFPSRNGRPYTQAGIRSHLRRRGIRSSYSLRHTFAQWFLDKGGPDGGPGALEELQRLLGHASIATTQIYAQVRDTRLRQVARRLQGPLPPRSANRLPTDT